MVNKTVFLLNLCLIFSIIFINNNRIYAKNSDQKLLIILVDGFRWDYVSKYGLTLKGFPLIAHRGVSAQYVTPIFPANSYPNWYAITTGLYAESHGMVGNYMYDRPTNDLFLMAPNENASHAHWWTQAEPIWINAERNGVKAAMYLWDGCQVSYKGVKASMCDGYRALYDSAAAHNQTRAYISSALDVLARNDYRLAMVYHELVDHKGHRYGPESEETKEAIHGIDGILEELYHTISERHLEDVVNVVIVSDHGMVDTSDFESVHLSHRGVDFDSIERLLHGGSVSYVWPVEGKLDEVYAQLKAIAGLVVYKKDDMPAKYHYRHNARIAPLVLTAHEGFRIAAPSIENKVYPHTPAHEKALPSKGSHGYDPDFVLEMRAVMYGFGPAFKKNVLSVPLAQVDHYNLFCHILGLEPRANNGTFSNIEYMLSAGGRQTETSGQTLPNLESNLGYCVAFNAMLLLAMSLFNINTIFKF